MTKCKVNFNRFRLDDPFAIYANTNPHNRSPKSAHADVEYGNTNVESQVDCLQIVDEFGLVDPFAAIDSPVTLESQEDLNTTAPNLQKDFYGYDRSEGLHLSGFDYDPNNKNDLGYHEGSRNGALNEIVELDYGNSQHMDGNYQPGTEFSSKGGTHAGFYSNTDKYQSLDNSGTHTGYTQEFNRDAHIQQNFEQNYLLGTVDSNVGDSVAQNIAYGDLQKTEVGTVRLDGHEGMNSEVFYNEHGGYYEGNYVDETVVVDNHDNFYNNSHLNMNEDLQNVGGQFLMGTEITSYENTNAEGHPIAYLNSQNFDENYLNGTEQAGYQRDINTDGKIHFEQSKEMANGESIIGSVKADELHSDFDSTRHYDSTWQYSVPAALPVRYYESDAYNTANDPTYQQQYYSERDGSYSYHDPRTVANFSPNGQQEEAFNNSKVYGNSELYNYDPKVQNSELYNYDPTVRQTGENICESHYTNDQFQPVQFADREDTNYYNPNQDTMNEQSIPAAIGRFVHNHESGHYQNVQSIAAEQLSQQQFSLYPGMRGKDLGHAIAIFGFGGTLVVSMPKRSFSNVDGHTQNHKAYPGSINIQNISKCIDSIIYSTAFPVLTAKTRVKKADIELAIDKIMQNPEVDSEILLLCEYFKLLLVTPEDDSNICKGMLKYLGPFHQAADHTNQIETFLLQGACDKACKFSMDNGLWEHALIISRFVDQKLFALVAREFVKSTYVSLPVTSQSNCQSPALRVLYCIFSGNGPSSGSLSSNYSFGIFGFQKWDL